MLRLTVPWLHAYSVPFTVGVRWHTPGHVMLGCWAFTALMAQMWKINASCMSHRTHKGGVHFWGKGFKVLPTVYIIFGIFCCSFCFSNLQCTCINVVSFHVNSEMWVTEECSILFIHNEYNLISKVVNNRQKAENITTWRLGFSWFFWLKDHVWLTIP